MTEFVVVIPARYASTRLPAKALVDIAGKPMVVHVADRARDSGAQEVWIATDDERIVQAVQGARTSGADDAMPAMHPGLIASQKSPPGGAGRIPASWSMFRAMSRALRRS